MSAPHDDFYIGYFDFKGHARVRPTRRAAQLFLLVGALLALTLIATMRPFSSGIFEFGIVREFEGRLRLEPYPTLEVERPGAEGQYSRYLLVAFGKMGAQSQLEGLDGSRIKVHGSLIHREGRAMIELSGDGVEQLPGDAHQVAEDLVEVGNDTIRGEIVDSKCFLGVMKPGSLKTHRACATRCISGGIPPLLIGSGEDGERRQYLLVDQEGGAVNDRILDIVAEPVIVSGKVTRRGDLWFLHADPATIRRVD